MKKFFTTLAIFLVTATFLKAQVANMDFESTAAGTYSTSNSVSGWSVTSQALSSCPRSTTWNLGSPKFAVLATPIASVPVIGSLAHSPLGGTQIVQLNNTAGTGYATKLSRTFSVTSSNLLFQYAYAAIVEGGNHTCCEGAFFKAELFQNGNLQSCFSYTMSPDIGCQSSGSTFSTAANGFVYWTNWQVKFIDLSAFINTNVTIEISASDCTWPGHYGTAFFDSRIVSPLLGQGLSTVDPSSNQIYFCAGSSQALAEGPPGYSSYTWVNNTSSINFPLATTRTLAINSPVPGATYSLFLVAESGCVYTQTYTVSYGTVNIVATGSSSTCIGGNIGSATVVPAGSSSGYTYNWINASNSVVATNAVANNLLSGTYTISVTSAGATSLSCGTSTAAVTVNTGTPGLSTYLKYFCGNEAYLQPSNGSNYQWYTSNLTPITASLGGTSSSFTLSSPVNLSNITVAYTNNGCRDSLNYVLVSIPGGNLSTLGSLLACPGSTNGIVTISMTPASTVSTITNFFSVSSTGTTTAYSSSINPTPLNTFTASNLSAGGAYSVVAFDGVCKYSTSFSITPYVFNYTVSPSTATLCNGSSIITSIGFSAAPAQGQYSYSWTPSTFLAGTSSQNTILSPTVGPGVVNTIIYTVVVTPTVINCPQTKTISITSANPLTPTISSIPPLCANAGDYTISANPAGGSFANGTSVGIGSISGVFSPSLQTIGVNTFTYANSVGTCVAKSSGTYVINALPVLSISGNTLFCKGQSTTLLASGADTYSWSNESTTPYTTFSPSVITNYTLEGNSLITNCSNSEVVTLSVVPYPQLSIAGNTLLCPGQSATLIAIGAYFYNWDNGSTSYMTVVTPTTNTTYTLTGTTSLASCSSTQAITVSTSDCNFVGLKELSLNGLISVYPNPTNGKIILESVANIRFSVHDALGRLLREEKTPGKNFAVDLSNYPNGVYLLKVYYEKETKLLKLIKTD
ncbi:hypothetical protein CNR22_12980 [Sphingobacteriaceae bacterium]|nr:hypothetical protein CNR22_12980 [Sphingobacteriaceae bacterium]